MTTIKTDTNTYPENPKSIQLPPAGGKYIDDLSGVEVIRFTDERDGNGGSFSTTYSVWDSFNVNNTRLWLFEQRGPYYVAGFNPDTFERVGPLEEVVPARGAFVDYETAGWSSRPDIIFIAVDCQIWAYNCVTKSYDTVADLRPFFPAGARFNQLYVSRDDNRFAAVVRSGSSGSGDHGIMVYERSSSTIKLNVQINDINGITMDKSGKFVILVRNDPEGQVKQRIYNVDTGAVELLISDPTNGQPDYCIGHNDCGNDFIVAGDQWRGAFTARKLSTPHDITMAWQYATSVGWILGWHVSCRADNESWALVSTFGGLLKGGTTSPDGPFVREIFQLGVKPPFTGQFRRLVHDRANWVHPNYWDTPRGTISRDGRFLCWTSNNNGPSGIARTEVMVARIEPAPTDGTTPPTPEPPKPDPPKPDPQPPDPQPEPPKPPTGSSVPVVVITAPANNSTVSGEITVTASVTDTARIIEVYLLVDGVVAGGPLTAAPYQFKLDTKKLADGNHSLLVRAWNELATPGDGKISVNVVNSPAPQPEPPIPPKPCSISAPASISIARNSSGKIPVQLQDLTGPVTVTVSGSDGQVTVTPLTWNAGPSSTIKEFGVKVKRQSRSITFSSPCGSVSVKVNVVS